MSSPLGGVRRELSPSESGAPERIEGFYHEPPGSRRYGVISTRMPTVDHWYIQSATSIGRLTQP
jgi:hypothetical protein